MKSTLDGMAAAARGPFLQVFRSMVCLVLAFGIRAWAIDPTFAEHNVGDTDCGGQGQTTLTDVDLDGDWDWLVACKEKSLFFFEFKGKDAAGKPQWAIHNVGDFGGKGAETSGKAFDITGDGYPDHFGGGVWFENPGAEKPITGTWTAHTNNGVDIWGSDAIVGDWNHDGRMDVAMIQKGSPSTWFDIPKENPRTEWIGHVWPGVKTHSGLAAGDMNADGLFDAVVGKTVYLSQNQAGTEWKTNVLPVGSGNCITDVGDADDDGDMDVVHETHWGGSDISFVENVDGSGTNWKQHVVGRIKTKGHSANVADFNNDGMNDFQMGDNSNTSYIYVGQGNKTYKEIGYTDKAAHDVRAGDVDQDGDLDMLNKPWGGGEHWYIENLTVDNGGPVIDYSRGQLSAHNWMNPNRPKKAGCMDPKDPKFDFWALHDGPITEGCTGVTISGMKAAQRAIRETWALSLAAAALEKGRPAYRVDGSRLLAVDAAHPRWEMAVGKRQLEGGVR